MKFKLVACVAFAILSLASGKAKADWVSKMPALTCDPVKNIAMIRFDVIENSNDAALVKGPILTEEYQSKYGYLATYKEPVSGECDFADGRKLVLSGEEGQAYPSGMDGGDVDAFFTLMIDGKPIYYGEKWYAGYSVATVLRSMVILDGERLFSCKGPKGHKEGRIDKYVIKNSDCVDETARLSAPLSGEELIAYNVDHDIEYIKKSVDDEICKDTGKREFISIDWEKIATFAQNGIMYDPDTVSKGSVDINNDGTAENLFLLEGFSRTFSANYFVFFDRMESEKSFEACMKEKKCPSDFDHPKDIRYSFNIKTAHKYWPDIHPVSALLLKEIKPYENAYNHTSVKLFRAKNRVYLYFQPENPKIQPYRAVGRMSPHGEMETVCFYGAIP